MEITLESLGLTKKALQERIIDLAVEKLLCGVTYDDNGNVEQVDTKLQEKLRKEIKDHIDETIRIFAEKNVFPKVTQIIETINLQQTNTWGEKKGQPVTFVEYLVHRAEEYMLEPLDSYGKSEKEAREKHDSWYGDRNKNPRIAYMIDKYLSNKIEEAMKDALKIANSALLNGIQGAVNKHLAEIVDSIKCSVQIKK